MTEQMPHVHRCACGASWTCSKADCFNDDDCTACEHERFEQWAEANALTVYQPLLQPESALLATKKED